MYSEYIRILSDTYDLRPSTAHPSCPKVLVRRACSVGGTKQCLCRFRTGSDNFLDHSSRWIDPNGQVVWIAEPYIAAIDNFPDTFRQFRNELDQNNIVLMFGTVSPWSYVHASPDPITNTPTSLQTGTSNTQLLLMRSKTLMHKSMKAAYKSGNSPIPNTTLTLAGAIKAAPFTSLAQSERTRT